MYTLWVLTFALGAVSADVGLGYDYKVPHTSYGVPSYQLHGSSSQNLGYTDTSSGYNYKQPVNKFIEHSTIGQYATNTHRFGVPDYQSSSYQHVTTPSTIHHYPSSLSSFETNTGNTIVHTVPQYQSNNEYLTSALHKYQQYYVQQQPAEVYKHFYVHSAPEEPELPKPRQPIVLPPPQKHYKIIFVKAPTENRVPQVLPVAPQNEEKTIVYVLVKKPEEQEVIVPKVEQKPPTKPEVYFIKYNNKQDSQSVIENIVNDYNKGHAVSNSNDAFGSIHNTNLHQEHSVGSSSDGYGVSTVSVQAPTPTTFTISETSKGSGFGTTTGHLYTGHHSTGHHSTGPVSTGHHSTGQLSTGHLSTSGHSVGLSTGSSTTGSSNLIYDHANTISTSQGIPHETYGPPKFRPN